MKKSLFLISVSFLAGGLLAPMLAKSLSAVLPGTEAFRPVTTVMIAVLLGCLLALLSPKLPVLPRLRGVAYPNRAASRSRVTLVAYLAAMGVTGLASAQTATAHGFDFGVFAPLSGVLFNLLGVGLVALTGLAGNFVMAKTANLKNERFRLVMMTVETVVFGKVREINAEAVATLKAASADGTLTQGEAAAALATAVRESWAALPVIVQAFLTAQAGGSALDAQSKFIAPTVKATVENVKTYGTLSANPPSSVGDARTGFMTVAPSPSPAKVSAAKERIN